MGFFYISILSVVQGITEFLPVSSSAHLFLISELTNQPAQNLQVDVAVHFGTLLAIILFYRNDTRVLLSGIQKTLTLTFNNSDTKFFHLIVIATAPIIFAGLFLKSTGLIYEIRSLKTIGYTMIIFGFILYLSDKYGKKNRFKNNWSYRDAFIMGLWQAIALIPGTSRSGNTISGGLILGFSRECCVNLSLLMSIPTILASSSLLLFDFVRTDFNDANLSTLSLCSFLSFLTSLAAVNLLVRYVRTNNFTPFVVYRLILGSSILYLVYN